MELHQNWAAHRVVHQGTKGILLSANIHQIWHRRLEKHSTSANRMHRFDRTRWGPPFCRLCTVGRQGVDKHTRSRAAHRTLVPQTRKCHLKGIKLVWPPLSTFLQSYVNKHPISWICASQQHMNARTARYLTGACEANQRLYQTKLPAKLIAL